MLDIFLRPHADPVQLPLAASAWPMCIIVSCYLLFVLKLGRQFMANREPFELRNVLKVYNLIQILYNSAIFITGTWFLFWHKPYNMSCLTMMPVDHPLKQVDRIIVHAYYINKLIDLLDTVFIVLRKSYKQISMLHLIHHVYMATAGYICIRLYGYGGHLIVTGYLNAFVHIVMYSYYYLSSQSLMIKRSLQYKQYITILQMVQFVIIFGHSVWTLMQPNCGVSIYLISLVLFMSSLMFVMFSNFYIHAYILPKKTMTAENKLK